MKGDLTESFLLHVTGHLYHRTKKFTLTWDPVPALHLFLYSVLFISHIEDRQMRNRIQRSWISNPGFSGIFLLGELQEFPALLQSLDTALDQNQKWHPCSSLSLPKPCCFWRQTVFLVNHLEKVSFDSSETLSSAGPLPLLSVLVCHGTFS